MPQTETGVDRDTLIRAAQQARESAYAPYSNYKVGAALLTRNGTIFTGCNVENASYSACICAERVAVTKAISEGQREFIAIAVVTSNGATPCGICRQVMNEFASDMLVIIANTEQVIAEFPITDLLPHGFGPEHLA